MPVGLQPNNRVLVARGSFPLAALPLQPANAPSPTRSPTPQLIPYMAGLPAAERERVMATVLQLLADGIITPYSGESKGRARVLLPVAACVLVACCHHSLPGHPFAALQALPELGHSRHNISPPTADSSLSASRPCPTCPLAGERFPLDQVVAAAQASKVDARGGKVLLEG